MLSFVKKRRWLKISLGCFGLLILAGAFWFVRPNVYLPHQRIVLSFPYDPKDAPDSLKPMGEKIYHPKAPHGHPGIDFTWDDGHSHNLIAAADGKVVRIKYGGSVSRRYDLQISHGVYYLRYDEMLDTAGLKVGDQVRTGQVVGHAGHDCDNKGDMGAYHCWSSIHWELASKSLMRDRFCPMTYFTGEARISLQTIWDNIPANDLVKSHYPDICSGDYKNKTD